MGTTTVYSFASNPLIEAFEELELFGFAYCPSFGDCVNLHTIKLPLSVRRITNFLRCNSLTELIINEGCTTLAYQCFWNCTFTQVLPTTITTINAMVIDTNGRQAYDVICKATTVPSLGSATYIGALRAVYVPDESFNAYSTATNWSKIFDAGKLKRKSELPDNLKKYWP